MDGGAVPGLDAALSESDFPLGPALAEGAALAIITGVEGPSYRKRGAAMAVHADGRRWGSLSSGCLERDVVIQAQAAMADGQPRRLRYGRGSPFLDITLPCGGGLDICIVPRPDPAVLQAAAERLAARQPARLVLTADGRLAADGAGLVLHLTPQLRLLVFGAGEEAAIFAATARSAGYPVELASPDADTLEAAGFGREMTSGWPAGLTADPYSAVTVFFHDHDREPDVLRTALTGPAFYVGAQGSLRAHLARREALLQDGLTEAQVDRLASPFGLIPSARDSRTLAISVLADVLAHARLTE